MLNDRFNGGIQNELKSKFRDKKFVSAVAIGIFILALLIVLLFGKGCKSKHRQKTPQPVPVQTVNQQTPGYGGTAVTGTNDNVSVQPDLPDDSEIAAEKQKQIDEKKAQGKKLIREGLGYYNRKNYKKARECFQKAKALGAKGADDLLKKCK